MNLNETDWTWEWAEAPVDIGNGSYYIQDQNGRYEVYFLDSDTIDRCSTTN